MMPVIFFGHGNPMNAVSNNAYTRVWASIGKSIPRPKAILSVSAHYYLPFGMVTSAQKPPTIHEFDGFPKALYDMEYPAPGNRDLARHVIDLLAPISIRLDESWGLDHGTWAVLCHVFPDADIPVVQLSIDESQPPIFHYEIGKRLMHLRHEGVLVMGSGNIVHNLKAYVWGDPKVQPFDWAVRFENQVREMLKKGDDLSLVNYSNLGKDAMLAVPTPDHYLPFLYVLGLRKKNEPVCFPVEGVDGGSVSMLTIQIG